MKEQDEVSGSARGGLPGPGAATAGFDAGSAAEVQQAAQALQVWSELAVDRSWT